ncbi:hypothetical protein QBC41DRAFT_379219 [Cercophora samala]|uniref:Uncharacterized protein n=1 Tax=Cercophora samala TaxID=330535 RepID=A0AA39Z7B1_9PEZI|nr:hypothetical protein QBC41DRAFT_379219 [Cercophora samala]
MCFHSTSIKPRQSFPHSTQVFSLTYLVNKPSHLFSVVSFFCQSLNRVISLISTMKLPPPTVILTTTTLLLFFPQTSSALPQRYTHDHELVPPPPSPLPPSAEDAIFKTMTTPHIPTQEEGLGGRKGTTTNHSPPPPPEPQPPRKSIGTVPPSLRDTPLNIIPPEPSSAADTNADSNPPAAFNPTDIWGEGEENPYDWPRREPDFGSLRRYPRPEPQPKSKSKAKSNSSPRFKTSTEKPSTAKRWKHWIFWSS